MKTYSIALQDKSGTWFTNWGQYFSLEEIDWDKVREFCASRKYKAYGHYFGHNSRNLTSSRCRTIKEELKP